MYRAEKHIDGVLHYKTTPDGEWIPYTPEELSTIIITLKFRLTKEKNNDQR